MTEFKSKLKGFIHKQRHVVTDYVENNLPSILLIPGWIVIAGILVGSLSILVLYSFLETVPPNGTFEFTLENYQSLFDGIFYTLFLRSISIAFQVTAICIAIAYPVAYYLSQTDNKYRNIILLLLILPLWVNIIIKAYSWQLILGQEGLINYILVDLLSLFSEPRELLFTQPAVVIGIIHILLPFLIIPLYTSMRRIDSDQIEAAKNAGANRLNMFLTIIFPQTVPALGAGGLLVFILAFAEFPTPAILGGQSNRMIGNIMTEMFRSINDWGLGSALAVIFTAIVTIIVLGIAKITGLQTIFNYKGSKNSISQTSSGISFPEWMLSKLNYINISNRTASRLLKLSIFVTVLFLYFPLLMVALLSFSPTSFPQFPMDGFSLQWYAQLVPPNYDEALIHSLLTSLQVGIISTIGATIIGTFAVIGISKGSFSNRLLQGDLLTASFILPMVLPYIVAGISVLALFSLFGVQGTYISLIIGHIFITVPFVFTVVSSQYGSLDDNLEEAALNLGASRIQALYQITLPVLSPAIIAGALFAFSISFDNFTQTFFWSGPDTQTLPVAIFSQINFNIEPTINAIGTIIVLFSLVIAFIGERIVDRYM